MLDRLHSRRRKLHLALGFLSLAALACTCTALGSPGELFGGLLPEEVDEAVEGARATLAEPTEEEEVPPTDRPEPSPQAETAPGLPGLLAAGRVASEGVEANSEGQIQGPILTVQLTNPESEEVVVEVPCGLIFRPETAEDEQRLMSIQPASTTLSGDGSAQVEPYVICIDADRAAPSLGTAYEVGEMASGDLLKLAECLCEEELAGSTFGMEQMGVQFAVWSVSSGMSMEEMLTGGGEGEGALGEFLGEEGEELFGMMQEMFVAPAQEILERCDIELEQKAE